MINREYSNTFSVKPRNPFGPVVMILVILLAFWMRPAEAVELSCDSEKVTLNGQVIVVKPNGSDDTENLQCALDEAIANDYATVRLVSGDFKITSILVENFSGTLEGTGKLTTTLSVMNFSVDCAGMTSLGMLPAAIKFVRGEPRIRFMTINTGAACETGENMAALIHFTGTPNDGSECSNDVVFANADRLIMHSANVSTRRGILASAEGYLDKTCKVALLGTVKLNQSEVTGFRVGIETSMRSGAQVDINFTSFANITDVVVADSNQSTTITNNTFSSVPALGGGSYTGVRVMTNNVDAPNTTAVIIKNNSFDVVTENGVASWAVLFTQFQKIADINSLVSKNNIKLNGTTSRGVVATDVSNGVVVGNTFSGSGEVGVQIGRNGAAENTKNWTIIANKGFASLGTSISDIQLGPAANASIIGPEQGATVIDWGFNNTLIP